jgi:hypothetical protein
MWRSLVEGSRARKARKPRKCTAHTTWWATSTVLSDHPSTAAEMGHPMIDHCSNSGRPTSAMRSPSVRNPVTPMRAKVPRMSASSGLVLVQIR